SSLPANQTATSSGAGSEGGGNGSEMAGAGGAGGAVASNGAGGLMWPSSTTSGTAGAGGNPADAGPGWMSNPYETDLVLTLPGEQMVYCDEVGNQDLTGVVVDSGLPAELWIDTCEPGTGCAPAIVRLSATGPGLTFSVPPGSFARVQYSAYW